MRALVSDALIVLGLLIVTVGVYGVVRLPTVYGQVHAASKVAFLGVSSLLAAAAVQGDGSTVARAVLIIALLAITTPVSAHVIARAAYRHEEAEPSTDEGPIESPDRRARRVWVMKPSLCIALITAAVLAVGAPTATAQTREYEGTIVSVDRDARTFRIKDSERGTIRVKVTSRTRFERISFSRLRAGQRNIETTVRRSNGRWIALEVERSGGGGRHGGDDDRGRDD